MPDNSKIEGYLEIIYLLEKAHGHAHVRDIAGKLNIKKPSVSEALRKLKKAGHINYQRYGFVTLTPKGFRLAQNVYKRHKILFKFMRDFLGIDADTAEEDACRIEHVISSQTLKKMKRFVKLA